MLLSSISEVSIFETSAWNIHLGKNSAECYGEPPEENLV